MKSTLPSNTSPTPFGNILALAQTDHGVTAFGNILAFAQMTNSKQYCDYCGERWSFAHSACRPQHRPRLRPMRRLFDATGKRLSTVRVEFDNKLFEISPMTGITFATEAEWKAAYPTGVEAKVDATS